MIDVQIKKAATNEIDLLRKISCQTFIETFSSQNSQENMKTYLEKSFSYDQLMKELSNPRTEFYFVLCENHIIGYLKINFKAHQGALVEENMVEIERIYVLKKFHRMGVGQLLCDKAISIAHQKKADCLWLGVWEKNPQAIKFYEKNGFLAFDRHTFTLGKDDQTDLLMKLKIDYSNSKN